MFENLTTSLSKVFRNLRGRGRLTEENLREALAEVRMALLEADVHFQVAKDFIKRVEEGVLGEEVLSSVTPGQQFVARVQQEMVRLLGEHHQDFHWKGRPTTVMMLGLHGAGKTTTTAKLALRWKEQGKKVMVVGCDIRRPAAVDQLRMLATQVGVEMVGPDPGETVPALGARALDIAQRAMMDVVIFDTGGRFQIDEELVTELAELRGRIHPHNAVLVLDAAMGQESVSVAETFHNRVGLTGLILTKLDGDARGGAALSVQSVTGVPIHLVGVGEKSVDLQEFYPDRMASRILGMGDVVTLVERAQESVDAKAMEDMEKRMFSNQLTLEDMLVQFQQMKKMGPLSNIIGMMPGLGEISAQDRDRAAEAGQDKFKRFEAIIQSMTPLERRKPGLLNASRRRRIAHGSGTHLKHVNELLKAHEKMKKMGVKLKKMQKMLLRRG